MKRPSARVLKNVFIWLDEYGFAVYGPARDRKSWEDADGGCMDYNVEDVLSYYKALKGGKIPQERD